MSNKAVKEVLEGEVAWLQISHDIPSFKIYQIVKNNEVFLDKTGSFIVLPLNWFCIQFLGHFKEFKLINVFHASLQCLE